MKRILAILMMFLMAISVSAIRPVKVDCDSLGFDNTYKIDENPNDGTYEDGTFSVDITVQQINEDSETTIFDWKSNMNVDAVIVKAGNLYNVYDYNPAQVSDTGLYGPKDGDKYKGVSHVEFCYDTTNVPEFGTIGAGLALVGASFVLMKKRK